jgi:hypothetical protein
MNSQLLSRCPKSEYCRSALLIQCSRTNLADGLRDAVARVRSVRGIIAAIFCPI